MITILTYHHVLSQANPEHYSVTLQRLEEHLDVLESCGMVPVDPGRLREPKQIGSASFFLTFDDGHEHHADLTFPLLEKRGLRGIFFVPSQRFDRPGFLRSTDAQRMAKAGHLFGLHGHLHRRLDKLNPQELAEDFSASLQTFQRVLGQSPWIFAPVGGYDSPAVRAAACSHGVRALRTMRWGLNHHPNPMFLETIPVHRDLLPKTLKEILEVGRFGGGYRIKEILKQALPENLYNALRERLSRNSRSSDLGSPHV